MTNPQQHSRRKPSPKMLKVLKDMAEERGITYVSPATAGDARQQFEYLKAIPRSHRDDARREIEEVRADLAAGGASAVSRDEIGGYGSTAHWR